MVGCQCRGLLGRVPWKQFLSELSLVLICHKVGMVTANHILGPFFAFVAMGIGVFHSFVFCGKKRVLLPPLPCPPKCAADERGAAVIHRSPGQNLSAGGRLQGHFV